MAKVNPYTALKNEFDQFVRKCFTRKRIGMFRYAKAEVERGEQWALYDLAQRVRAAAQLGYTVELRWADDGLNVDYVEKLPAAPLWY